MNILDELKKDFIGRAKELDSAEFHLGNGENCRVYWSPVVNTIQSDKYMPLMQENKLEGYVELLITRAKNQDRTPMFTRNDKADLMKNVDPVFIVDVGNKILGADSDHSPQAEAEQAEIEKK